MASIEDQVKRIVINKVKLSNGKTVRQNLIEAVNYLYDCIQDEIDIMYDSYAPIEYKRRPNGENLRTALYVEDFLQAKIKGNRIELSLKFSSNVWAWNFSKRNRHKSNVAVLMHEGWQWENHAEQPDRFTWFEGYPFIKKGVDRFNQSNRWGVIVDWDIDVSDWY